MDHSQVGIYIITNAETQNDHDSHEFCSIYSGDYTRIIFFAGRRSDFIYFSPIFFS